ncbi:hypothetical protein C2845_PM09G08100 [Panicum miliaceum]|uniref:Uncharacterized protein n=1 Tax=Panicum miliaceum TaxID=4540 RepID=A0A3L6S2D7_PANMI|nr:hypothetical protein C2845_PM09G08100 [Panicum miliaceum]
MELVLKVVGSLFCVLCYADQEKNGTVSGFLPKMIQAYNEISGKLKKNGKGDFHKKVAEVISKRLRYLLNETLIHAAAALDPPELYRSNLAKKSSSQFAVTMAIKKLAKSTSEAAAAIDQYSRFIEKRGLFGDPEARWSALNGKTSSAGNPIMVWLNNSMSESTPILDEYDDSDDDWSTPSNFIVESLQMEAEELAAFKRKVQLGKKNKRKCNWVKMMNALQMTMTQILQKKMVAQFMPSQGTAVPTMKMMVYAQRKRAGWCMAHFSGCAVSFQ